MFALHQRRSKAEDKNMGTQVCGPARCTCTHVPPALHRRRQCPCATLKRVGRAFAGSSQGRVHGGLHTSGTLRPRVAVVLKQHSGWQCPAPPPDAGAQPQFHTLIYTTVMSFSSAVVFLYLSRHLSCRPPVHLPPPISPSFLLTLPPLPATRCCSLRPPPS